VILFLWLSACLLMTGMWFDLKGELQNRDGRDDGQWCNSGGGYSSVLREIDMGMRGGGAPKLI
jgi:hypothetical protein